ncbi:MAG: hypothetical protein KBA26_02145 [Candidatus Delongbacteria bacterium]|nr:hypothetical protein [Candidatus Delongbacteria bacterium]
MSCPLSPLKIRLYHPNVTYFQDYLLSRQTWIVPQDWNTIRFYRYSLTDQQVSIINPRLEPLQDGFQQAHYPIRGVPVWKLPESEYCRWLLKSIQWRPHDSFCRDVLKDEGILHHYSRLSSMIRKYRQLVLSCLSLDTEGLDTRLEPSILRWLPRQMLSYSILIPAYWDWRQIMLEDDQMVLYTIFKPQPRLIWAWIVGLEVQLRLTHSIPTRKTDLTSAFHRAIHPENDGSLASDYQNLMAEFPSSIPGYPHLYSMLKIIAASNLIIDYSWPNLIRELGFLMVGWWEHKMIDTL